MANNSTEISYGFGQMGSAFTDEDAAVSPPTGKVIVAITFLEDTKLTSLTPDTSGYTASDGSEGDAYFGSATAVGANGTNAAEIDASTTFPKGLTIYGRWTQVDPRAASTDGGIICYFGY